MSNAVRCGVVAVSPSITCASHSSRRSAWVITRCGDLALRPINSTDVSSSTHFAP
jgi:hypothetical protein